jgi:uncharacterized protein with von Willebrand factor type A (vWA) domain
LLGGRQNVPEIMIIITDGISENQTATTSEAKTAKLKGIKIIVVGIGNRPPLSLENMTSRVYSMACAVNVPCPAYVAL